MLKIYTSQNCTDEEFIEKLRELKAIEDEINENNLYNNSDANSAKKKNKTAKAKKNNKQKKKSKDNVANSGEKDEKLYEINDIDLLCSIIQNSNDTKPKAKPQGKKN